MEMSQVKLSARYHLSLPGINQLGGRLHLPTVRYVTVPGPLVPQTVALG